MHPKNCFFFLITKVKAFQTFSIACPTDIIHFIIFSWQEPTAFFLFSLILVLSQVTDLCIDFLKVVLVLTYAV